MNIHARKRQNDTHTRVGIDGVAPGSFWWLTVLLLGLMGFGMTGCVAPRAVALYSLAKNTAPVSPGEISRKTDVHPVLTYGDGPSLNVYLTLSRPPGEILRFYREYLRGQGWVEEEDSKTLAPPEGNKFEEWYHFNRVRSIGSGKGMWKYSKEKLVLILDASDAPNRPKGTVNVEFDVDCDYAWDIPSKLPAWALVAWLGEGAQAFWWINLPF